MRKIILILSLIILSNLLYSQEKIGFYFIDKNYKDTIFIYERDSLYYYVHYAMDGPVFQFCKGKECNGLIEEYYLNRNLYHIGFYSNGQILNGFDNYYYENGKPEQIGQLKDGHRIGQWIWYTEKGFVESIYQYDSLGRKTMELSFSESGRIKDYSFYENDSVCLCKKLVLNFYETGELETHYYTPFCDSNNNQKIIREYHKNGVIKLKGQYLKNEEQGKFEYFNSKGVLIKTEEYRDGKLINTVTNSK